MLKFATRINERRCLPSAIPLGRLDTRRVLANGSEVFRAPVERLPGIAIMRQLTTRLRVGPPIGNRLSYGGRIPIRFAPAPRTDRKPNNL